MALFKKKKDDDGASQDPADQAFEPQPEKARKFFDHARTAAMSSNYDYALELYARGLRLDPGSMVAHQEMYKAALQYAAQGGAPAKSKEVKTLEDGTVIGKFAACEFAWMKNIGDGPTAIKALEAAIAGDLQEFGHWMAGPVLRLLRAAKKPSKSQFMQAKDLFSEVGAWNEAIAAGEIALSLDPSDNELSTELKGLAAQRAMDQGGYGQAAGQEGGFRTMVKDLDRQRELEESDSLSANASVEERNLARAQKAYEDAPGVPDNVRLYAQLLKKQNTPEAIQAAYDVYMKGFRQINEYQLRMAAGDIRIELLRLKVRHLQEKIESNGADAELQDRLTRAAEEFRELRSAEYRERVSKYPTNRTLRYELGRIEYELGRFDDAMECFQKAKDEPKLRVRSGHMLGRCFASKQWHMDAIAEYRDALGAIDATEAERELSLRYDLMLSLIEHAREERSIDLAREARDLCSTIARRDISYRDIRDCRTRVDQLVKDLSGDS